MARPLLRFDLPALKQAFSLPIAARSFVVALVVGTVLNLINQGVEILSGQSPHMAKLLLTYVVPFFVASFGSYFAYRQQSLNAKSDR